MTLKAFLDHHVEDDGTNHLPNSGDILWEDGHYFVAQSGAWIEQEPEISNYQISKKLDEILAILKPDATSE